VIDKSKSRPTALSDSKDNHQDLNNPMISPQKKTRNYHHFDELDHTLHQLNFNHHREDSCLCNDCSCGRHLCKLNIIKPDLKKSTIYQKNFGMKKPNEILVVKQEDVSPLKGDHLDLNSLYLKDYQHNAGDKLERPKPQD
jgi:hypothetical protein